MGIFLIILAVLEFVVFVWIAIMLVNIVHLLETLTNSLTMFCSALCRKFQITAGDFPNEKEKDKEGQEEKD